MKGFRIAKNLFLCAFLFAACAKEAAEVPEAEFSVRCSVKLPVMMDAFDVRGTSGHTFVLDG